MSPRDLPPDPFLTGDVEGDQLDGAARVFRALLSLDTPAELRTAIDGLDAAELRLVLMERVLRCATGAPASDESWAAILAAKERRSAGKR